LKRAVPHFRSDWSEEKEKLPQGTETGLMSGWETVEAEGSPGGVGGVCSRVRVVSPPVFGLRTWQEVAAGRWGDKQVTRAFSKATKHSKWRVSLYIFEQKIQLIFWRRFNPSGYLATDFFKKRKSCPLSLLFKCFILAVTWRWILANIVCAGCFFFTWSWEIVFHRWPTVHQMNMFRYGFPSFWLGRHLRFVPCANCSMSNGVINGRR